MKQKRQTITQIAAGLALLGLAAYPACAQGAFSPNGVSAARMAGGAQSYLIAVSDQMDITVQGHDDLRRTVEVLPSGSFDYPIAGSVPAVGKTPEAVAQYITKKISTVCNEPVVSVIVTSSHLPKISVLGGIKNAGQFDFHPGMRVLDAIAASGGLMAPLEQTQATLVTDGGQQSRNIDLVALMSGAATDQNAPLAPGDILLLQQRDPSQYMVQVLGQVNKPGAYPVMTTGASVLNLLTQAGGATATAALSQVQILHAGQSTPVNLHNLSSNLNDSAGAVKLLPGDTLLVPENKEKIAVLGEVRSPAVYPIPDGEKLTVSTALAQAGGLTSDADKKNVVLLRQTSAEKRTAIALNLNDFGKGDNDTADMPLQPGDIISVQSRGRSRGLTDDVGAVSAIAVVARLFGL